MLALVVLVNSVDVDSASQNLTRIFCPAFDSVTAATDFNDSKLSEFNVPNSVTASPTRSPAASAGEFSDTCSDFMKQFRPIS
jgi:hypothetical protein